MKLLALDFETYYDKEYSLSRMTTEEYIRDPRFETIGVSVKVDDSEPEWASGTHEQIKDWLQQFPWADSIALAHNAMFDGAILNWHFALRPKFWVDTLCMGRPIHGVEAGGSLAKLAERYKIGEKGSEVLNALGKHRVDFSAEDLSRYGDYCVNDTELTYKLFDKMLNGGFPRPELKLIDLTTKMFTEPVLELDLPLLEQHLGEVKDRKETLLKACGLEDRDVLMSNPKLAELLQSLGVSPPRKISLTTGKETWAFAKSDEEFKALLEYPDEQVQAIVAARLGAKSTLEESRTERFIGIAKRGVMPVPLKYYAAHTGRWGGLDSLNLQNLPSRGANAGKLKRAIIAPEGYAIIDCDSSQIEARVLAWLAGQQDVVDAFAKREDVYKKMAARVYDKAEDDVTKEERFIGKTTVLGCFGADTKVLTHVGWKRIVEVQATDLLWDGEEWVSHLGVVPKGLREVITAYGVDVTPEHEILTEHGWQEWCEVTTSPSLFQSALRKANSQSSIGDSTSNQLVSQRVGTLLSGVVAGGRGLLIGTTLKPNALPGAMGVLKEQVTRPEKNTGGMKIFFQISNTGKGFLTALQAVLHDATQLLAKHTRIMGAGGSLFTNRGELTGALFYSTSPRWSIGKSQSETLTASTTTGGTNQTTYVLPHGLRMQKTSARREQCKKKLRTYDIAYAGRRNRFTIATNAGNIIVHNCGYGMGAPKFQVALKTAGVDTSLDECRRIISTYRETNDAIVALWRQAQTVLVAMSQGVHTQLGREGVLELVPEEYAIKLPNGLLLRYADLSAEAGEKGLQYSYKTRQGRVKIYGGKVVENVVQALARIVVGEQMVRVAKKYRVVLTVHDAVACIAPQEEAGQGRLYVEECMRWVPAWALGLPVNCESGVGKSYGEC